MTIMTVFSKRLTHRPRRYGLVQPLYMPRNLIENEQLNVEHTYSTC